MAVIYDHKLVGAVQRIAGNGTGDTRWKVPGLGHVATVFLDAEILLRGEGLIMAAGPGPHIETLLILLDEANRSP